MLPIRLVRIIAASLLLVTQGCHPVISDSASATSFSSADTTGEQWPFRFKLHSFGVACYSTYDCKVLYAGQRIENPDDALTISSESIGPDYKDNLSGGRLGIRNFPPPAIVTWRSKDGSPHRAEVDMAEIFKDELVLHNVPKQDVEENALRGIGDPEIILEVNDRTINVYMKAFISTRSFRTPGNPQSRYRDDLILAHTRTY